MISLSTNVEELPKVGVAYAKKLRKFGIKTVQDLLFYFPQRYDDFSEIINIKSARQRLGEVVCVQGQVSSIENIHTFKRRFGMTKAVIQDDTAEIEIIWFNQPYIAKSLKEDDYISVAGKVSLNREGLYISNPSYERIYETKNYEELTHTGRIVPVYSETKGLTSKWLRYIIKPLLWRFGDQIKETLPKELVKKYKFLPIQEALWQLHFPESFEHADAAKTRFSFEDLFLIQLNVLKEKIKIIKKTAPACKMDGKLMKKFTESLPFKLTDSQRKCAFQILKDLEKTVPMSRLLEGDVGSGKTVVATMAALSVVNPVRKADHEKYSQNTKETNNKKLSDSSSDETLNRKVSSDRLSNGVENGHQVAFMAPTEILAKQHFQSLCKMLTPFKVSIGLITGKECFIYKDGLFEARAPNKLSARSSTKIIFGAPISKKSFLGDIENGQLDIIIGTHSLIQKGVEFKNLGLVVVDEQHRFGVEQRSELAKNKKIVPHLLSMTATPIPRTLALTIYGDLDLSLIDEMPKDRKKIKTVVVESKQRKEAYDFIEKEVKEGKGVFVICPKIENKANPIKEAPQMYGSLAHKSTAEGFVPQNYSFGNILVNEVKAVKDEYEKLSKEIFPDLNIAMLHGKLKSKEKEKIMNDFRDGAIDILVSTSVVEVGVDVPRATIMMIEGAERFGLSQLHQFRGRVGRSNMQSYCFLFTTEESQLTRKRLKAMTQYDTGFELAQVDLEIRGPGSLYGTQQWGLPDIAMQGLSNIFLVEKTRQAAKELLEKDPSLEHYPELKERLKNFEKRIHFE